MSENFRAPTDVEQSVISALLDHEFDGSTALQHQSNALEVAAIDQNGSLKLRSSESKKADTSRRIPIEAEFEDSDGITVHVLLHVVDGQLDELEVYREDSGMVRSNIDPSRFRFMML